MAFVTSPRNIAEKIFSSTIPTCIHYATSVWGQTNETNQNKFQRLQNYGAKIVLNYFNNEHCGMDLTTGIDECARQKLILLFHLHIITWKFF